MKSIGSAAEERFAAARREEGVAQRRVCEIWRVACRGWPTVMMCGTGEGGVRSSEAVCKMWVCGIETVMTMRLGGLGEGGATTSNGLAASLLVR